MKKKVDNRSLRGKVEIRRWLLREMGITEARVLDACAGAGHIWTAMRSHVTVTSWVRCDIKPRQAGTLKMTATQAMDSLPLDQFNVIDIDPYGEPWEAYLHAIARLRRPTAIFLTRGRVANVVTSKVSMLAAGLPAEWAVPRTPALANYLDRAALSSSWNVVDVLHASTIDLPHVAYFALGVQPRA